jgi:hypothetical protein
VCVGSSARAPEADFGCDAAAEEFQLIKRFRQRLTTSRSDATAAETGAIARQCGCLPRREACSPAGRIAALSRSSPSLPPSNPGGACRCGWLENQRRSRETGESARRDDSAFAKQAVSFLPAGGRRSRAFRTPRPSLHPLSRSNRAYATICPARRRGPKGRRRTRAYRALRASDRAVG